MSDTFYADISRWQPVVSLTRDQPQPSPRVATVHYPYPILAFRADTGSSIDANASANWAFCRNTDRIQVAIAYVVFIPGQRAAILNRVKALFGATAPAKLALMIDMESGQGFAGPGNHSTEANGLADDFATYLGDRARVVGYANSGDWHGNWPSAPSWMKRITASYGLHDPGSFGWQYYGGVSTDPSPGGYPRTCPPFGSNVDMNVIHLPISSIVTALGLGADMALDPNDPVILKLEQQIAALAAEVQSLATIEVWGDKNHPNNLNSIGTHVTALQAAVTQLQKVISSLPTTTAGLTPAQIAAHLRITAS